MVVKTYRGLLADGGQDRIRLQTIKGKVGYRIVKFQVIPKEPSTSGNESIVKIYKEEDAVVDTSIDFTDGRLLGCAYYSGAAANTQPIDMVIIFDREIFNQDIYITHYDNGADIEINYYLELEVIPLDDAGAEYTTLKDMRAKVT